MEDEDDDNGSLTATTASTSYKDALLEPQKGWTLKVPRKSTKNNKNQTNPDNDPFQYDETADLSHLTSLQTAAKANQYPSSHANATTTTASNFLQKLTTNRAIPPTILRKTAKSSSTTETTNPPPETATPLDTHPPNTPDDSGTHPAPPPRPPIPLGQTPTKQWLIIEIPKPTSSDNHIAEAVINLLQTCYYFDARFQILPIETINPYTRTPPPIQGGTVPNPFIDDDAKKYLAKHFYITRDVVISRTTTKTTYIHLELQINTFTNPHTLATTIEDIYIERFPRSKIHLHPLNSPTYQDIGYLQYSSLQVNLDDLQSKIHEATNIKVYLKHDNINRFINPDIDPKPKGNNIITIHTLEEDSTTMISELKDLFPLTPTLHQCQYLTCRIMVFLQLTDLCNPKKGFDTPTTIKTITHQIAYSSAEKTLVINSLHHADHEITIPSTKQLTSIRSILTTLMLPTPSDLNISNDDNPQKLMIRSAEPNRNKLQPPNSITINFHQGNKRRVLALLQNLQLAVEQTYEDPDLFPLMLAPGQTHTDQPISLIEFYTGQILPTTAQHKSNPTTNRFSHTLESVHAQQPTAQGRPKSPTRSPDKKKPRSNQRKPPPTTQSTLPAPHQTNYISLNPRVLFRSTSSEQPHSTPTQAIQPQTITDLNHHHPQSVHQAPSSTSTDFADLRTMIMELKDIQLQQQKKQDIMYQNQLDMQQAQNLQNQADSEYEFQFSPDQDTTMTPSDTSTNTKRQRDQPSHQDTTHQYYPDDDNDE